MTPEDKFTVDALSTIAHACLLLALGSMGCRILARKHTAFWELSFYAFGSLTCIALAAAVVYMRIFMR